MAKVQAAWIDGSADWNTLLDWDTGVVPNDYLTGSVTDVTLPGSAAYTVTISAGEGVLHKGNLVNSESIIDALATLAVDGSSSTQTSLKVSRTSATAFTNSGTLGTHDNTEATIDGSFANSGTLDVDNNGYSDDEGGGSLPITGTPANTGAAPIGNNSATTTATLGGLTNSASTDTFSLSGTASHAATLASTGTGSRFTSNGGNFELAYASPLTPSASFTNSGTFGCIRARL